MLKTTLQRAWYAEHLQALTICLLPLSLLFYMSAAIRRFFYRVQLLPAYRAPVPVIVVGNISVGGTGKTPLVAAIVDRLAQAGYSPGVISRGYSGCAAQWPQSVTADSDPFQVGDEPVLIAGRCGCPVVVGPNRRHNVQTLLANAPACNVIVSDDGLQHYALRRDIEIAVIDGVRRLGNGWCLPAGPLREPASRLNTVDIVVVNGECEGDAREHCMQLQCSAVLPVTGQGEKSGLAQFKGVTVHAVAAIGNNRRFFNFLMQHDIKVIEHGFDDHHRFAKQDILFNDELAVLMTEKDAVKCRGFADTRHWTVKVDAVLYDSFYERLMARLNAIQKT